ncbi:MAG: PIN domain protein [Spirochaetaceae bacterium]|jgi:predicted nucleic acid-binding protein|nr:PIN domain protein [Spirochaetaceae bacterium]
MRVYLDNCCFNRTYDDQSNIINRVETEAKLLIQYMIKSGALELVWSEVLDYENNDNPFDMRREKIAEWEGLASVAVAMTDEILTNAHRYMVLKLKPKDASHIVCAVSAHADYFITVDRKILNKPIHDIPIINPIDFLRRLQDVD